MNATAQVEPMSVNPMVGPSVQTLISCGAQLTELITECNQAWRMVTPMFMHAGGT